MPESSPYKKTHSLAPPPVVGGGEKAVAQQIRYLVAPLLGGSVTSYTTALKPLVPSVEDIKFNPNDSNLFSGPVKVSDIDALFAYVPPSALNDLIRIQKGISTQPTFERPSPYIKGGGEDSAAFQLWTGQFKELDLDEVGTNPQPLTPPITAVTAPVSALAEPFPPIIGVASKEQGIFPAASDTSITEDSAIHRLRRGTEVKSADLMPEDVTALERLTPDHFHKMSGALLLDASDHASSLQDIEGEDGFFIERRSGEAREVSPQLALEPNFKPPFADTRPVATYQAPAAVVIPPSLPTLASTENPYRTEREEFRKAPVPQSSASDTDRVDESSPISFRVRIAMALGAIGLSAVFGGDLWLKSDTVSFGQDLGEMSQNSEGNGLNEADGTDLELASKNTDAPAPTEDETTLPPALNEAADDSMEANHLNHYYADIDFNDPEAVKTIIDQLYIDLNEWENQFQKDPKTGELIIHDAELKAEIETEVAKRAEEIALQLQKSLNIHCGNNDFNKAKCDLVKIKGRWNGQKWRGNERGERVTPEGKTIPYVGTAIGDLQSETWKKNNLIKAARERVAAEKKRTFSKKGAPTESQRELVRATAHLRGVVTAIVVALNT